MKANPFAIHTGIAGRFALSGGSLRIALALLLCAGWVSACGDPEKKQRQQLEQAVDQVARIVDDANRRPMAAAALQSTLEGGGTLLHYVVASLPDTFNHRISVDRPATAWSVVLHQAGKSDAVIVEGYGSDLKNPLFTRTAKIGSPPARR